MATGSRVAKVKVSTSRAQSGREMGHPRVSAEASRTPRPSEPGRFGVYGGRYVPETLVAALVELEAEYARAKPRSEISGAVGGSCCGLMRGVRLLCF